MSRCPTACSIAASPGCKAYQAGEVIKLKNAAVKVEPWKTKADNLDALVYMILADAGQKNDEMKEFLWRDKNDLSVYSLAQFGLALHKQSEMEKRDAVLTNLDQYLVQDEENETAYLKLPEGTYWWYWYGSDVEANAWYLKLLSAANAERRSCSAARKILAQQPQAFDLLGKHPRHVVLRRGVRQLHEGFAANSSRT